MFWIKVVKSWSKISSSSNLFYLLFFIVPLMIYPFEVDVIRINLRQIREISFYSFGIIVMAFFQENKLLRYFLLWCLFNWWVNFFIPNISYGGLTNILIAIIIYSGIKSLIKKGFLKIDLILKIFLLSAVFQIFWLGLQLLNKDIVFYPVTPSGGFIDIKMPLISWSGNSSILSVNLAMLSFLGLHYFKIKKIPVIFFVCAGLSMCLKNFTGFLCLTAGSIFYIAHIKKLRKFLIILPIIIALFCCFLKMPNFDRVPIWEKILVETNKDTFHSWVGSGINYFSQLLVIDKKGVPWKEAHNDYLQLILELGRIGFILFMGFIISKFIEFERKKENNLQLCIISCLVAYLTAGLSLFPFHLAQLSFYAVIVLACLEASYDTGNISPKC